MFIRNLRRFSRLNLRHLFIVSVTAVASISGAQQNQVIFDDQFRGQWQSWSWASTEVGSTDYAYDGTKSIRFFGPKYSGFYAGNAFTIDTTPYKSLRFAVHGGPAGGQRLRFQSIVNNVIKVRIDLPSLEANTWRVYEFPLADIGAEDVSGFKGFHLMEAGGKPLTNTYIDRIELISKPIPATAKVTLKPNGTRQPMNALLRGINTSMFDPDFRENVFQNLAAETKPTILRFPGPCDGYNWETNMSVDQTSPWLLTFDHFLDGMSRASADGNVGVNYGSGTPELAARMVRHANIIRGKNVKHWDVGNEPYHPDYTDLHAKPQDPVTYAREFVDYYDQMKAEDPSIRIGVPLAFFENGYSFYPENAVTNPRTGVSTYGWTPVVLSELKRLRRLPDYVTLHRYEGQPGIENDATLLTSVSNLHTDIGKLRQLIVDYVGPQGNNIGILVNECNSVWADPGKQTVSLVSGLYYALTMAEASTADVEGMLWWNWKHSAPMTQYNLSPTLYGWRQYGDYGMLRTPEDRYPVWYVAKMLSEWAEVGDEIISADTQNPYVRSYGVRKKNGSVRLLMVNTLPSNTQEIQITFEHFSPKSEYRVMRYGIPQDEAARTGVGDRDAEVVDLTGAVDSMSVVLAPYSINLYMFEGGDTISGKITFGDLPLSKIPTSVSAKLSHWENSQLIEEDVTLQLDAAGNYSLSAPVTRGPYTLTLQHESWLREVLNVNTEFGSVTNANMNLQNGDINQDNTVDLLDYFVLSDAYLKPVETDGPTRYADLNRDSGVDLLDYFILSAGYGKVGK